tara:strand:+ start:8891 stop:9931 length:1041 start_codon:yes stop_codon:yes gene_type:complete
MNTTHSTLKLIIPFISENVPENSNIIIGCSGGADSSALTILLATYSTKININIKLVYVNHNLRDIKQINNEKLYVKNLAKKYGLKFGSTEITKEEFKNNHNASVENTARILRFNKLADEAKQFSTKNIFLGHTATDKAETILFNIIRGTGLKGLEGINHFTTKNINKNSYFILRPLLDIERITTEQICIENGLAPMNDVSNNDLKYTRNKIRKEIFPLLTKINPKIVQSILDLGSLAKDTNESYELLIDKWYSELVSYKKINNEQTFKINNIDTFNKLPSKLKTEIIKNILTHTSIPKKQIRAKHIFKIIDLITLQGTKYYDLPNKVQFIKEYNIAFFKFSKSEVG